MATRYVLLVAAEAELKDPFVGPDLRKRSARHTLARRLEGVAHALRNGQEMGVYQAMTDSAAGVFLLKEVDDES